MFLQRSAVAVARRAAVAPVVRRTFATTVIRRELRHGLRRALLKWAGENEY